MVLVRILISIASSRRKYRYVIYISTPSRECHDSSLLDEAADSIHLANFGIMEQSAELLIEVQIRSIL